MSLILVIIVWLLAMTLEPYSQCSWQDLPVTRRAWWRSWRPGTRWAWLPSGSRWGSRLPWCWRRRSCRGSSRACYASCAPTPGPKSWRRTSAEEKRNEKTHPWLALRRKGTFVHVKLRLCMSVCIGTKRCVCTGGVGTNGLATRDKILVLLFMPAANQSGMGRTMTATVRTIHEGDDSGFR